jgi:hypothetical protein
MATTHDSKPTKAQFKQWLEGERSRQRRRAVQNPRGHLIFQILYWLLIVAIVFFAYLNINPYQVAVEKVLGGIDGSGFVSLMLKLPVLGAIVSLVTASIYWILGAILWAGIQILEVAPMLLERDEKYMGHLISEAEDHDHYEISDEDDPLLGQMKRAYNTLPVKHYKDFKQLAFFAYTVDFLICFAVYPPVNGGFGKLFFVLLSGQFGVIDWKNVALAIVTLFAIEATLKIIFMVGSVAYRKQAQAQ